MIAMTSSAISLACSPSTKDLNNIIKSDLEYKGAAVQAALTILEASKSDRETHDFVSIFCDYRSILEPLARRDGAYVGWSSLLFNCASRGDIGSASWSQAISIGKELVVAAIINRGETCIPFAMQEDGCSLHSIGEMLKPDSKGNIYSGNRLFKRTKLLAISCGEKNLYIDESHGVVNSCLVSNYVFPGGIKAKPLAGPKYEDTIHKTDISSVKHGVSILSDSWEFGTQLVAHFASSIFPVLSPNQNDNISVSSALFPGWIVASLDTPLYMAECLVHEASHNLLYALSRDHEFTNIDCDIYFYSPWRPDPRPPEGLLHACFVFCNVIDMYYHISMREEEVAIQSRYRLGAELKRTEICLETLYDSDLLTLEGLGLVEALAQRTMHLQHTDIGILSKSDLLHIDRHLEEYQKNRRSYIV